MSAAELVAAAVSGSGLVSVRVSVAAAVAGALAGASLEASPEASAEASAEAFAEAVEVSEAVLGGRSIGHLVRYRYFPVYLLVHFCVRI